MHIYTLLYLHIYMGLLLINTVVHHICSLFIGHLEELEDETLFNGHTYMHTAHTVTFDLCI